jgi:hypothetical protein
MESDQVLKVNIFDSLNSKICSTDFSDILAVRRLLLCDDKATAVCEEDAGFTLGFIHRTVMIIKHVAIPLFLKIHPPIIQRNNALFSAKYLNENHNYKVTVSVTANE